MISNDIYAVIVNWNLADKTIFCVESLITSGLPPEQIIIVDNGSDDDSVTCFSFKFGDKLTILSNPDNKGFAAGVNQGILEAMKKNAKWIFLINNDAYVERDFFKKIKPHLCNKYDIVSPIIYYHHNPHKIWFVGDRLIPGTLFTIGLWKNKTDSGKLPEILEIDFANGAGMLIKRNVFETIGLFNEKLFMYGEEVDFCWRAKKNHFRIIGVTSAKMWHEISASASKKSLMKFYLKTRNQTIFYKRYTTGLKRISMLSIYFIYVLIKSAGHLLLSNFNVSKTYIKGFIDGLRFNEA